jgi:hypothetical protein
VDTTDIDLINGCFAQSASHSHHLDRIACATREGVYPMIRSITFVHVTLIACQFVVSTLLNACIMARILQGRRYPMHMCVYVWMTWIGVPAWGTPGRVQERLMFFRTCVHQDFR